ncbi:MAG: dihydroorotate dehydrogenase electron transfer subunit [Firmicutes bacterium]|nr:dihydroorotate dehydrogenase electron transfer subunit [Alicyclobacillaceae bacterium]MCL6496487.1 dihydroorotate dehydrogenase electron transfer subunit [Bacillota bacterium]
MVVCIERREVVARDHVELYFRHPALTAAVPGQFAHILTEGTLRRPLSFSRLDPASGLAAVLFRVVGRGTAWLAARREGEPLDLLGPLGRGFPPPEPDRPWCLVGGGVGIPPLFAAWARWKASLRAPITVIAGARTREAVVMVEDFRAGGAEPWVTTDDGSLGEAGTVLGPLRRWLASHPQGQVYACGPTPMLAAVAAAVQGHGPCYLGLEQRMGCGVGACLACVVPAADRATWPPWRRVCCDGPVFLAEEVRLE